MSDYIEITEEMLWQIAPHLPSSHKRKAQQADIISKMARNINEMMKRFDVVTLDRQAFFLAQTCQESDGWQTTREYASGRDYEGRKDLGNIYPGDGVRFAGHGIIQTTGRYNHQEFSDWCHEQYPDAPDFVEDPERLMDFPWAMLSAFFYWESRNLNHWADQKDFRRVTKLINGGYNGLAQRQAYLAKAYAALGGEQSTSLLKLGVKGRDVATLQNRLNELGYRVGKADGHFGTLTQGGVLAFQADQALTIDGKVRVGGETWTAIEEALAAGDKRPLGDREEATGSDLSDSRIVNSSDEANGATIISSAVGGAIAFKDQIAETIGIDLTAISTIHLILGVSVLLNLYLLSRLYKARRARLEDHRTGKTL